jgi:lipid intermediate transporter
VLLLLFDVYLTWARIEKSSPLSLSPTAALPPGTHPSHTNSTADLTIPSGTSVSFLSNQPLILQYLFFLFLVTAETLAFHVPIRLLCTHTPQLPSIKLPRLLSRRTEQPTSSAATTDEQTPKVDRTQPQPVTLTLAPIPYYPHPAALSTALLVSSCTKLFPILLIIWDYDLPSSASAVSWAVIVNNVAALEILMDCGFMRAGFLVAVGAAARALVGWGILALVGLRDLGPMGVWGEAVGWIWKRREWVLNA